MVQLDLNELAGLKRKGGGRILRGKLSGYDLPGAERLGYKIKR